MDIMNVYISYCMCVYCMHTEESLLLLLLEYGSYGCVLLLY